MPPTDADPWADLYADLGVAGQPTRAASSFLPADDLDAQVAGESPEEVTAAEPDADSQEGEAGGAEEVELGEDGQPKRRRRRRRRRGGAGRRADGSEGEAAEGESDDAPGRPAPLELGEPVGAGFASDDGGEEAEDFDAPPPPPSPRRRRPVAARDDDSDEGGEAFAGATQATVPTQSEWKVPSWAEIVRGLYRPDRHER